RQIPIMIFLLFLNLYLWLPTQNWNYADDALRWAYDITLPGIVINTHHLYLDLLRYVYALLSIRLGIDIDPVRLLSAYSALCGALGLAFLYKLISAFVPSRSLSLLGVLLCGSTVGYWSYSIVGDVYVPATSFLIIGFYSISKGLTEA